MQLAISNGNKLAEISKQYKSFCYTECHDKLYEYLIVHNLGENCEKAIGYRCLATCYLYGKGVEKDKILAKKYYLLALGYGDNGSCYPLYILEEDKEIARNYLKLGVKSGIISSQYQYGLIHFDKSAKCFIENKRKAFKYINMAVKNDPNNKSYENNLARLYHCGVGVERDVEKAKFIYEKLANKGDYFAMNNLASMYSVDGNLSMSFKYIKMASKSNNNLIN